MRAFQAYFHHATQGYEMTTNLIAFGLLGTLNKSNGCVFAISTIEMILRAFAEISSFKPSFQKIYSLPSHFTVDQYVTDIMLQYLKLVEKDECDAYDEASAALCMKYLPPCLGAQIDNSQLYMLAVSVFSSARSDDLRAGCSTLLGNLKVPIPIVLARTFTKRDPFLNLFKISLAHDAPFSPIAMRHLWSITSGVFEAGQPGAFSVLSKMLTSDEFVSRRASAPGEPAPQNPDALRLAAIWHPLIQEMGCNESVRAAVDQSGIIPAMLEFYKNSTRMPTIDPQRALAALECLERLNRSCHSRHNLPEEVEGR
ncbi:hypothetical protein BDV93DRAFT_549710 [Ceratobasidium sp. AG-I]|nr:hypothetical protein BDV93DRAFT_549710 [Ceratobasidium sp. AG-I]